MNYYKKIAEMLGLELEQEFVITDLDGKRKDTITYKFTEDGLFSKANNLSVKVTLILDLLLTGKYKAVPKPWKPKDHEHYWYYSATIEPFAIETIWAGTSGDLCKWKCGNCFLTKGEAETKGKEFIEALLKEYEEA